MKFQLLPKLHLFFSFIVALCRKSPGDKKGVLQAPARAEAALPAQSRALDGNTQNTYMAASAQLSAGKGSLQEKAVKMTGREVGSCSYPNFSHGSALHYGS